MFKPVYHSDSDFETRTRIFFYLRSITQFKNCFLLKYTVNIRKPEDPVFECSFSGHFLGPVFEWSDFQMPSSTRFVWFSNGTNKMADKPFENPLP
jgi:hypothetical protein